MLGTHEREAPPALAEVGRAVRRVLADSREIVDEYRAASLAYRRTALHTRRLREELRAERVGLKAGLGRARPESA